jgi:hypothetical protein
MPLLLVALGTYTIESQFRFCTLRFSCILGSWVKPLVNMYNLFLCVGFTYILMSRIQCVDHFGATQFVFMTDFRLCNTWLCTVEVKWFWNQLQTIAAVYCHFWRVICVCDWSESPWQKPFTYKYVVTHDCYSIILNHGLHHDCLLYTTQLPRAMLHCLAVLLQDQQIE